MRKELFVCDVCGKEYTSLDLFRFGEKDAGKVRIASITKNTCGNTDVFLGKAHVHEKILHDICNKCSDAILKTIEEQIYH